MNELRLCRHRSFNGLITDVDQYETREFEENYCGNDSTRS